jgi:hypothetical protein
MMKDVSQSTDRQGDKIVANRHRLDQNATGGAYSMSQTRLSNTTLLFKETPMSALLRLPLLLLLGAVACQKANPGTAEPSNQTRAKIENRASVDMDISVRRNDGRSSPLGFAPGGETTVFRLPAGITAGASWIRFEAKPVRSSGETVVSEPFPVTSGDEITWSVSPQ